MSDTEKTSIKEIEHGQPPLNADEALLQSLGYKQVNTLTHSTCCSYFNTNMYRI